MNQRININNTQNRVKITTGARLHMGFYDLTNGAHQFAGMGLSIDAPSTVIELQLRPVNVPATLENDAVTVVQKNDSNSAYSTNTATTKIVENVFKKFKIAFNIDQQLTVNIAQTIPAHIGLGSGTQLALAIGAGLNQLLNLQLSVGQIASFCNRGNRSGIGTAAFAQGGFLVDAGKVNTNQENTNQENTINVENAINNIAYRQDFPTDWRILLISDSAHIGVHGEIEMQAFQRLKPAVNHLHSTVLNHMLPALKRGDLLSFGAYMQDIQAYNGHYFASVQGGQYASHDVADVLHWLQQNGAACVGQSSWGPTGFAVLDSVSLAQSLQLKAQQAFATNPNIGLQICRGKNTGALLIAND